MEHLTLELIRQQLNQETAPDVFAQWMAFIEQRAAHCEQAARLAVAAEDVAGVQHWSAQLHDCTETIAQVRERIRHLRDTTSLELQWRLDS